MIGDEMVVSFSEQDANGTVAWDVRRIDVSAAADWTPAAGSVYALPDGESVVGLATCTNPLSGSSVTLVKQSDVGFEFQVEGRASGHQTEEQVSEERRRGPVGSALWRYGG